MPHRSICLFGTPGAERNLGVGALRDATVAAVLTTRPATPVTVFDDGWGVRSATYRPGESVTLCGARDSRRLYRPESFWHMRASLAVGGVGNAGARIVRRAAVVLDVSGGDSFSDIYGPRRFRTVAWPKRLALAARRPLVLLPQTYGPFADPSLRAAAAGLLRGATQVWARDPRSKQAADELIGAETCRQGVDLGFGLAPTGLPDEAADAWERWLDAGPEPVAGINVNGLLVNQTDAAERYGISRHHAEEMSRVAKAILDAGWRVVVVPHVLGAPPAVDTDEAVCRALAEDLRRTYGPQRVWLADRHRTAGQAKSVIARCSWFTGARMHSTIAALSSGVPTGGVAYSHKMAPVFAGVGQAETTVDARVGDSGAIVGRLLDLWRDREAARVSLAERLPAVLLAWTEQMQAILAAADQDADPEADA